MSNSAKTPLIVRFVILTCVLGALSVIACVQDPNDGSSGGDPINLGPGTVTVTLQAY